MNRDHRGQQVFVVGGVDGAQIQQSSTTLDPPDDRDRCGAINAAMTFASPSSVRGVTAIEAAWLTALLGLSGATIWYLLGVLAAGLKGAAGLFVAASFVYSVTYGAAAVIGRKVPVPSMSWQVPSTWIRERSRAGASGVWSVVLGPGLMTRNPFAGMALLILLLPTFDPERITVAAAGIGFLHGLGRAGGVLANMRLPRTALVVLSLKGRELAWRQWEGVGLLLIAGVLAGSLLGGHLSPWS